MANVQLTNYDINKQAYQKMPPMPNQLIQERKVAIRNWLSKVGINNKTNYHRYAGILCREVYDFTIVMIDDITGTSATDAIIEILQSRGEIIDIEHHGDDFGDSYQCWVRAPMSAAEIDLPVKTEDYGVVRLYVLFDATDWVVEA